jgi:hypothetical protein
MIRKIITVCRPLLLLIVPMLAFAIIFCFSGCAQSMARNFGGEYTINLPEGQKLLEITWKESELWYLSRPIRDDEYPETYTFQEDSVYGVWEGTVTIVEH